MAKVDTHGLKMVGLKKASGETFGSYSHLPNCAYTEIFYNIETGDVWANYQPSGNSWTQYDDRNIICVCNCYQKLHMQEIADLIYERINYMKVIGLI